MSSSNDSVCNNLRIKTLDDSDNLTFFDCSNNDTMGLNEFIHEEALQFQKEKLGVTHLFYFGNQIVGFATLAMSQIEVKHIPYILPFSVTETQPLMGLKPVIKKLNQVLTALFGERWLNYVHS